jgi:putative copper resistance protein D
MMAFDPLVAVRGIHFAATVLAAGTVCFRVFVAEPAAGSLDVVPGFAAFMRRLGRLTGAALGVAVLSGIAWLLLVAANILGEPVADALAGGELGAVLTDTRFGQVTCIRTVVALGFALLLSWPRTRLVQLAAAILWVGLLAPVGHAGAAPGAAGAVHLVSDIVHLLAAAAWLGGLPAFAFVMWQAHTQDAPVASAFAANVTARFSMLGMVSVGTLLVSGLANSLLQFDAPAQITGTTYGRLLLIKVALFAIMVAVAAINRYRITPRLPAPAALLGLGRNSLVEALLGLAILFVVAALGVTSPNPHLHSSSAAIPPEAAFVHLHSEQAMADITVDPGCAGKFAVTVRVMREDLSEFPASFVTVALEPPATGTPSRAARTAYSPDGTWRIIKFAIPASGIWTVRLVIGTQSNSPIVLDGPIVIAQCSNE